jgi:hypothetical protein
MTRFTRRTALALATAATAVVALVGATPAPAHAVTPAITLGPTVVINGVATVSGMVTAVQPTSAQLTVNDRLLQVSAAGAFFGTVDLNGQSNLVLTLTSPTGDVSTIRIPLTTNLVGPGGVISSGVLAKLVQAAVTVTKPIGGFVSSAGKPIPVLGRVADPNQLLGLSIDGIDVLSTIGPDGNFALSVPGTNKEVEILMTDRQGVTLETRYPVASPAAPVSAGNAAGLRIASIRYSTKRIKSTKRLGIAVTVKDRRGHFVSGAKVTVRSTRPGRIANRTRVKSTGSKGKVAFTMRLRPKAFGKRFVIVARAATPTAKDAKRSSVRLPRLARARR